MNDYISTMMKTAGIIKKKDCSISIPCGAIDCDDCKYFKSTYDFTAEKQLEIIKLIGNQNQQIIIAQCLVDKKTGFRVSKDSINGGLTVCNKDFTQALAQLTTELMKAGELDKEKVKGTLEQC